MKEYYIEEGNQDPKHLFILTVQDGCLREILSVPHKATIWGDDRGVSWKGYKKRHENKKFPQITEEEVFLYLL